MPADSRDLSGAERRLRRRVHQIIQSVTENMEERLHLNTCISSLMELTNEIYDFDAAVARSGSPDKHVAVVAREAFDALITMLAPFAPHIAEEISMSMGRSQSLAFAGWPSFDPELAREERIEVPVQINGKIRSRVYMSAGATEYEMRQAALEDEKVKSAAVGRDVLKVIVVPKKLVNVVLK